MGNRDGSYAVRLLLQHTEWIAIAERISHPLLQLSLHNYHTLSLASFPKLRFPHKFAETESSRYLWMNSLAKDTSFFSLENMGLPHCKILICISMLCPFSCSLCILWLLSPFCVESCSLFLFFFSSGSVSFSPFTPFDFLGTFFSLFPLCHWNIFYYFCT